MFKVNNKDTRTTPVASFWCLYCQLWTYFIPCSSVCIVNCEQVNTGWEDFDWLICSAVFLTMLRSWNYCANLCKGYFYKLYTILLSTPSCGELCIYWLIHIKCTYLLPIILGVLSVSQLKFHLRWKERNLS